jgi:phage/plasmid-like protein (TIGR03299 family)
MPSNLASRVTGQVLNADGNAAKASEAAMFYVKGSKYDVPWHKLGEPVDGCLTSAEALKKSGLDYEVKMGPIFTPDMKEIEGYSRTYRADFPDKTFGIVGNKYTICQNADAFNIVDAIIGNAEAKFDTAGALYDGRTAWMNAKLAENFTIAGDEIQPYFLLKVQHDGRGSIILCMTPTRTVCQNTLNMALGDEKNRKQDSRFQKVKHTKNYEARMKEAARIMGFTTAYYDQFRKKANSLVEVKFSEKQFSDLMDQLFGDPAIIESKRGATLAETAREKCIRALAADDLANIKDTGWGAYNAIADYADHMRNLRGENQQANAFLRTFEDTDLKDRALEIILATR